MILGPNRFPSTGFGSTAFSTVDITPLTYNDVINYATGPDFKPNSIGQYLWDIEHILANGVKGYKSISAFDINFLISMRKTQTVLKDGVFTLGDRVIKSKDLTFTEIEPELKEIFKVGEYSFHMPSIGEVEETLADTNEDLWDKPIEIAVIATALGLSVQEVLDFPIDMTSTIEYLKMRIISQPKLLTEGGVEDIILFYKSSDLFQYVIKSQGSTKIKIEFNKKSEDGLSE